MTMNTRDAFERGTDTFNAHDIEAFAAVLADDVVFQAPGGMRGEGKEACAGFFGSWFSAFPDAHVDVHAVHFVDEMPLGATGKIDKKLIRQRFAGHVWPAPKVPAES